MKTITEQPDTTHSQGTAGGLTLKGSVGDDPTFQQLRSVHNVKRGSSTYQNIYPKHFKKPGRKPSGEVEGAYTRVRDRD